MSAAWPWSSRAGVSFAIKQWHKPFRFIIFQASTPRLRGALAVSLVALVLYLLTLAPSTAMWDTSEYIAAAYTLGLPHPPGNPLFVIIGRVFTIIPIFGPNVATRINVL